MAMNVYDQTYRTEDSSYAVTVRVSYEPKTSLYEVNTRINAVEVGKDYFDDRKTALVYANTQLSDLWMHPVENPQSLVAPALPDMLDLSDDAPTTPQHLHRYDEDGMCRCGASMDDDDDEQPTDADVQAWLIEAETRGYEEPHLSHDPRKCRCGDCLTYLAGEQ